MAGTAVPVAAIAKYIDDLLDVGAQTEGASSNGLIIDAGRSVTRIAVAVNTSFASIQGATTAAAQLLLVHHTTWASIDLELKDRKEAALQAAGVSLYGAHMALDHHQELSPSVVLARRLNLAVEERFGPADDRESGVHGRVTDSFEGFVERIAAELGVQPGVWRNSAAFGHVGIVTGGGGSTSYLEAAHAVGCDTYVTGEGSMYTKLYAHETGLNLIFGTHYATEKHGIQALGERVADRFGLPWLFVREAPDIL